MSPLLQLAAASLKHCKQPGGQSHVPRARVCPAPCLPRRGALIILNSIPCPQLPMDLLVPFFPMRVRPPHGSIFSGTPALPGDLGGQGPSRAGPLLFSTCLGMSAGLASGRGGKQLFLLFRLCCSGLSPQGLEALTARSPPACPDLPGKVPALFHGWAASFCLQCFLNRAVHGHVAMKGLGHSPVPRCSRCRALPYPPWTIGGSLYSRGPKSFLGTDDLNLCVGRKDQKFSRQTAGCVITEPARACVPLTSRLLPAHPGALVAP